MEPAAAAKTPLHERDFEVLELHVSGAGKRPLWSKKWTILGILSVVEMLRQLALATRCETRHFEKTALRFACPELQIVLSVSLNALPRGVFEVIEDDITGNRLFA